MDDTYNVLLSLHILFVVVWVGGVITLQMLYGRVRRSPASSTPAPSPAGSAG